MLMQLAGALTPTEVGFFSTVATVILVLIVLDQRGWDHVVIEHDEMAGHRSAVIATIMSPEHRQLDPRADGARYWRRGLGPSRWLLLVGDFGVDPARVVTAYGNRTDPPGWTP